MIIFIAINVLRRSSKHEKWTISLKVFELFSFLFKAVGEYILYFCARTKLIPMSGALLSVPFSFFLPKANYLWIYKMMRWKNMGFLCTINCAHTLCIICIEWLKSWIWKTCGLDMNSVVSLIVCEQIKQPMAIKTNIECRRLYKYFILFRFYLPKNLFGISIV